MFTPKTQKIKDLTNKFPGRIKELELLFYQPTNVYIDFANVVKWQDKLGWHLSTKRLKHFFDSFDTIKSTKLYAGTLTSEQRSIDAINEFKNQGYDLHTKPVKTLKLSIDVSSIPSNSPDILKDFIRKPLLQQFKLETIELLNKELQDLNNQGILGLEDLKCNFDVEIGRDMLLDYEKNQVGTFVLWSGDSDFYDPIFQLLRDGKRVYLFATTRRVASELNDLRSGGLHIFDIQKIRDFICWPREINP